MKLLFLVVFAVLTNVRSPDKKEIIKILNVAKKYDTSSSFWDKYAEGCNKWELSHISILDILKSRFRISNADFHFYYDVLPCSYEGYILINGNKYYLTINAGSYLSLTKNGITKYFSCQKKILDRYFISLPGKN